MPLNAGYEYDQAKQELDKAKTPEDKIKALKVLLGVTPTHKGAETIRSEIKQKISKLKAQIIKQKAQKKSGGGHSISIKREGSAQVTIVAYPSSGKSTILKQYTNANPDIAEYAFTTQKPEVGMMDYHGVKIQMIEIPALFDNFMENDKGPALMGIVRSSDMVLIVIDGESKTKDRDLQEIEEIFRDAEMSLDWDSGKEFVDNKKAIVTVTKEFDYFNSRLRVFKPEDLKEEIWKKLNMVWVQTKTPGKKADLPPVALKKSSTVSDLADKVHKDFITNFKYARIWGPSAKHNGANVGLDHVLKDSDVVEFHVK